ncbi:hypothetical protein Q1695_003779 [Nippostrongylus brasiliensis]|nr:hypothetical protein Q1695_003779 [Nippostrongylus brasiliensis]
MRAAPVLSLVIMALTVHDTQQTFWPGWPYYPSYTYNYASPYAYPVTYASYPSQVVLSQPTTVYRTLPVVSYPSYETVRVVQSVPVARPLHYVMVGPVRRTF